MRGGSVRVSNDSLSRIENNFLPWIIPEIGTALTTTLLVSLVSRWIIEGLGWYLGLGLCNKCSSIGYVSDYIEKKVLKYRLLLGSLTHTHQLFRFYHDKYR